jgi:hypothetical protein
MFAYWSVRVFNAFGSNPECKRDMENMATYLRNDLERIAIGDAGQLHSVLGLEDDYSLDFAQELAMLLGSVERDFYWIAFRETIANCEPVKSKLDDYPPAGLEDSFLLQSTSLYLKSRPLVLEPEFITSLRRSKRAPKSRSFDDELEEQHQQSPRKCRKLTQSQSPKQSSTESDSTPSPTNSSTAPNFKSNTIRDRATLPKPATKNISPKKSPTARGKNMVRAKEQAVALPKLSAKSISAKKISTAREKTTMKPKDELITPTKPATNSILPKKSPAARGKTAVKDKLERKLKQSPSSLALMPSPHWAQVHEPGHLEDLGLAVEKYNHIYEDPPVGKEERPKIKILAQAILERIPGHRATAEAISGTILEWTKGELSRPYSTKETLSHAVKVFYNKKSADGTYWWYLHSRKPEVAR